MGTAVTQWLRCCATNRKVAGSIPTGVNGFFIDIKSFRSPYGPGIDSTSNRNEYQEYFLGVKSGRCVRLTTLPPSCAVVTKSGNLNFLEPSGLVQACNGTDLPFHFTYFIPPSFLFLTKIWWGDPSYSSFQFGDKQFGKFLITGIFSNEGKRDFSTKFWMRDN